MAESSSAMKKGTVTPMGSLFPPEEAKKASKRVQAAIADHRSQADRLKRFISDNSAVTKLVRQLPDHISHDVMVPFGSAAFFPGRLIHTNEFLVLLGDGYYAERTAKQTVEILKRRQKSLESQMEALKGNISDLETEAKFFDFTAVEAQEGLVEIREEYDEPQNEPQSGVPESDIACSGENTSILPNEEVEYVRMMAKLDELEKQELDAENTSESDEDEDVEADSAPDSDEDDNVEAENAPESDEDVNVEVECASGSDEDEYAEASFDISASRSDDNDDKGKNSQKSRDKGIMQSTIAKPVGGVLPQHLTNQYSIPESNSKPFAKEGSAKSSRYISSAPHILPVHPGVSEKLQNFSNLKLEDSSDNIAGQASTGFSNQRAFTGSVVEHSHGLPSVQPSKSSTEDQPSKPVSRFKVNKNRSQ